MRPPAPYGIYIHSPWCRIRCPYCAFYVETDTPRWEAWERGVLKHLDEERPHFTGPAEHVYFGGGTPSLAPGPVFQRLLSHIEHTPDAEITIEANPGTVTPDGLSALVDAGINRVSVGIQTFQPHLARLLARAHTVLDAERILRMVRDAEGLRSWSADLIFSVPGQTLDDLDDDLSRLIDSGVPHVSIYGLSYEPGTPLTRARDLGRITPIDPDAWADQYARVVERLEGAGLERYEVSNFGRTGHRARHNEHVWRAGHYMGLGPSAHGFRPDGTRTAGPRSLDAWLAAPRSALERPTRHEAAIDFLLSSLRHSEGVSLPLLEQRTGHRIRHAPLAAHIARKTLRSDGTSIRIGPHGWHIADGLVRALVDALQPTNEPSPPRT